MNETPRPRHLKIATREARPDEPMYRAIPGFCEEYWQAFWDAENLKPLTNAKRDEYDRLSWKAERLNPLTLTGMMVYSLLERDREFGEPPEWMYETQIAACLEETVAEVARILAALVEYGAVEVQIERTGE